MSDYTLSELLICAGSEVWRDDGEVLASGVGLIPRLAASLAMLTCNRDLMMTDSEAFMLSEPVPVGAREGDPLRYESWMGFSRIFGNLWGGRRHALVSPVQIDVFGQGNISCIGEYHQPKVQMLGVRGYPGNSMHHCNSFYVPVHSSRSLVAGEVDMVCSVGYNPERLGQFKGYSLDQIRIGRIITNLCVMDFGGPEYRPRLLSVHPGVTVEQVRDNTGFDIHIDSQAETDVPITPAPSSEQLEVIARMDPHDLRSQALPENPPGDPRRANGEG